MTTRPADRRRAGDRRAGLRHRVDRARRQDRRPRQRLGRGREGARLRRLRDRLPRRPERDRRLRRRRPSGLDRGRPDRAGRARSRRARDLRHDDGALARGGGARATVARAAADGQARPPPPLRRNGAIVVARTARARRSSSSIASRRNTSSATAPPTSAASAPPARSSSARWSAQAAGDYCTGSNHVLPTGGAARFRGGLSPADFVRTFTVQTLTRRGIRAIGPDVDRARRRRGTDGCTRRRWKRGSDELHVQAAARRWSHACISTRTPPAVRRRCSTRSNRSRAKTSAFYPDYAEITTATERYFDVAPGWVQLTNGLDEGLHVVAQFGGGRTGSRHHSLEPRVRSGGEPGARQH